MFALLQSILSFEHIFYICDPPGISRIDFDVSVVTLSRVKKTNLSSKKYFLPKQMTALSVLYYRPLHISSVSFLFQYYNTALVTKQNVAKHPRLLDAAKASVLSSNKQEINELNDSDRQTQQSP